MFRNIIAQNKAKKIITEQIKNNKIPHAYLFIGEDGIGKKKTALEFAKILNCTINDYSKTDIGACNHCAACEMINKDSYPDLHMINFAKQEEMPDGEGEKTKLGIDLIRYMQKYVYMKSAEGKWKIFIIEPAEKLTIDAFNSLLKTLEEPPEHTILILIAKHRETIPTTILSRTQTVFFQPLPKDEIIKYLQQQHSLDEQTAAKIAEDAEGSFGKAEYLMLNTQNEYASLWKELTGKKMPAADLLEKSRQGSRDRDTALAVLDIITESAMKSFRKEPEKYVDIIEKLSEHKIYLTRNANPNTVLDNLFLYINSKTV
jgi:DNA polymerase-3 subunit delta'